jgi:soluble lytic murein transglycosylase-like protein
MRTRILILCLCSQWLAAAPRTLMADIYFYVDKAGVAHFSNVPVDRRFRFKERERPAVRAISSFERDRARYDTMIEEAARRYRLDPRLLKAVIQVESDFDHQAVSEDGAMGLMQLMPEKASELGVRDAFNPFENLDAGARYLSELLRKYDGDLTLALAAYNAGEEAVRTYGGVPPFAETRHYIEKVRGLYPERDGRRGPDAEARVRQTGLERASLP